MPQRGEPVTFTPDQVASVRHAIRETQTDFAVRFSRSRFAIVRWEQRGVTFEVGSNRYEVWHGAVCQAVHLTILRTDEGATNEELEKLRELLSFSRGG